MTCTPDKCPHGALMEQARAACLACGRSGGDCTPEACPSAELLDKARRACLDCVDHVEPSARGGMVSFDAASERVVRREALRLPDGPRGRVTALPEEQEERLGDLLRAFTDLDTLDALLMLHTANGGRCDGFGHYLGRVSAQIEAARVGRASFRATAWSKFQAIVRRLPLAEKLRGWARGHGGAKPGHENYCRRDPEKEAARLRGIAERQQRIEARKVEKAQRFADKIFAAEQRRLARQIGKDLARAKRLAEIERRAHESGIRTSARA